MPIDQSKLLNLLQHNARASVSSLSKELFVSSPSVSDKIHKLEDLGIITGYLTKVNVKKLGYHVKAYISVNVEPNDKKAFADFLKKTPNIIFADEVTGDFNVMLCALFQESENLGDFINQIQQFGRTRTNLVFSSVLEYRGPHLNETTDI